MTALYRLQALLRISPIRLVPIFANRIDRHYSGKPALLNQHYRGNITAVCRKLVDLPALFPLVLCSARKHVELERTSFTSVGRVYAKNTSTNTRANVIRASRKL